MDDNFTAVYDIEYGSHERHKVDIFIPKNVSYYSGIILYVHGGGWHMGDKSVHYDDVKHFSSLGYVCATMNYRFVSENISVFDELDDITSALKTVKSECLKYGFNAEKLILSGGSAGAHLALLYAYTRKEDSPVNPVAVCAYCPPVDCSKPDFLSGISDEFEEWKYDLLSKCCGVRLTKDNFFNAHQQEALKKISPVRYVSKNCVPTAVFHGSKDELIPFEHINSFMEMLGDAGVKNDLVLYKNSGHALDKDPEAPVCAKTVIKDYAEMYF